MTDLREELGKLADFVGEPATLRDLESARRRRERRRRAEGLVVGLAVVVAAAVFLATTLRPGTGAVDSPSPSPFTRPDVASIWPEPWTDPNSPQVLRDLAAAVVTGDPAVQWRTDPEAVVGAFARDVLHWEAYGVGGQQSAAAAQWWTIERSCPPARCFSDPITIYVVRLPDSGVWVVQGATTSALGLDATSRFSAMLTGYRDPRALPVVHPGEHLFLDGSSGRPRVLGYEARNACGVTSGTETEGEIRPTAPTAPGIGDCGPTIGYLYVYTIPGADPSGSLFEQAEPLTTLTISPFLMKDLSPASPGPVGVPYCNDAPVAMVTILQRHTSLGGCIAWAADRPITLTVQNRDPIHVELKLSKASACDHAGCSEVLWTSPMMKGEDTRSFRLDPLPAGRYVLWDAVHPTSRLDIVVG